MPPLPVRFAVAGLLATAVCSFATTAAAAETAAPVAPVTAIPTGWFLWPAVDPAPGSALDVSGLNHAPAGKLGRITVRDGRFVTPDGARVRFWGCNIGGADAFVPGPEADALARRLARGGVNIARLHHLDNPWAVKDRGSLWSPDRDDRTTIDPAQLDKLHRLIAALRDQGIYSNLNLKVSKTLGPADGFPESVKQFPDFQKRVDIFSRRMIELQKGVARQLLTTKNPYTGLAPVDDPAVAIIEINNENSLLGYFTRDLGRGLAAYPEPFRGELKSLWNRWLARRYADDAALARAWTDAAPTAAASVLPETTTWHLKQQRGSRATFAAGATNREFAVTVEQTPGVEWHVQLTTLGLRIEEGVVYTVEFEAQADRARTIQVGVANDTTTHAGEEWRSFGLLQGTPVGTEWRPVRMVFAAHSVGGSPASLSLNFGEQTGTVRVRGLRFLAGNGAPALAPGQSAGAGTVELPGEPTTGQWRDWIAFLAATERAFAEEMRAFLRDELGVKAPIACSQIDFGGITAMNRERSMDFADSHVYWEHPDFPAGAGWDPARWSIRNSPQLAAFGARRFGALSQLAFTRVAGKPFSVSEYDHAAPSDFVCEMYPEFAVFGCRQDWDALYPFALDAFGARNPQNKLGGYFDQIQHPAKWGFAAFATTVFRRGLIAPAAAGAEIHPGEPVWRESPHADMLWHKFLPEGSLAFLDRRFAVQDAPAPDGSRAKLVRNDPPATGPAQVVPGAHGPRFVVADPRVAAVVGYLGGTEADAGALHVRCANFGRGFAAVTAVALDERPFAESKRVLVTLAARGENQGMGWNETRTSVGAAWGHGPTIAEQVPATITLAGLAGATVYPLRPDGTRGPAVAPEAAGAPERALRFAVQPAHATLHYEIVRE